jgi:hypothetical protein
MMRIVLDEVDEHIDGASGHALHTRFTGGQGCPEEAGQISG